jgi:hypothetical protein
MTPAGAGGAADTRLEWQMGQLVTGGEPTGESGPGTRAPEAPREGLTSVPAASAGLATAPGPVAAAVSLPDAPGSAAPAGRWPTVPAGVAAAGSLAGAAIPAAAAVPPDGPGSADAMSPGAGNRGVPAGRPGAPLTSMRRLAGAPAPLASRVGADAGRDVAGPGSRSVRAAAAALVSAPGRAAVYPPGGGPADIGPGLALGGLALGGLVPGGLARGGPDPAGLATEGLAPGGLDGGTRGADSLGRPGAGRPGRLPGPAATAAAPRATTATAITTTADPLPATTDRFPAAAGPHSVIPGPRPATPDPLAAGADPLPADLAPADPAVLDRLAQSLYGRLRGHFAAELLGDRERAQLLTDL